MNLEQELIDKGYWVWTKGFKRNKGVWTEPMLTTTPKWTNMIKFLIKTYPTQLISEDMITNYILEL